MYIFCVGVCPPHLCVHMYICACLDILVYDCKMDKDTVGVFTCQMTGSHIVHTLFYTPCPPQICTHTMNAFPIHHSRNAYLAQFLRNSRTFCLGVLNFEFEFVCICAYTGIRCRALWHARHITKLALLQCTRTL